METFSVLLAICAGNSPVTGEFPTQRPVMRSFDVFCDPCLNKWLSKQSRGWWYKMLSRPLWRHCNAKFNFVSIAVGCCSHCCDILWKKKKHCCLMKMHLGNMNQICHSPFCQVNKISISSPNLSLLTHCGRVKHICIGKLTIIGSDNSLSPGRRQAIIWTNAGLLLIGPLGTNFSEILMAVGTFSFKKMHLKILSAKWRPFCLSLSFTLPNIIWALPPLSRDVWFVSGNLICSSGFARHPSPVCD